MKLEQIDRIISIECHLNKDNPIVVGVSGGADSLCLLSVLNELNYPVIAANVNHKLRPEADNETIFVKKFARSLHVPFLSTEVDVYQYSKNEKLSIEEGARWLRYSFLFSAARDNHAQALAVAHQADDQVETVLMHLLRGAGTSGIKGMTYSSFLPVFSTSIPLVRPLLGVWRKEISDYCVSKGIQPCEDRSNTDTKYFRNRIRQELVPELCTYNSQAAQHIWQMARLIQPEDEYLDEATVKALDWAIKRSGDGFYTIDGRNFSTLHPAIQRRVLRSLLARLRSDLRDIGFEAIERGIDFINRAEKRGERLLLDGVWISILNNEEFLVFKDGADFSPIWPIIPQGEAIPIHLPGVTGLNDHWQIMSEIYERSRSLCLSLSNDEVFFDYDEIQGDMRILTPTPGLRIAPFGKGRISQKLSDLFINSGLHRYARKGWPVLFCGEQVIWVLQLKRGKFAPVTSMTKKVLALRLEKKE